MSETLATRAYTLLRAKLSSGELRPGQRLVNRTLAGEIGMSFTPVREAINQLASEGLIEYRRGSGAFVRELDHDELFELYDLREELEAFAAERAATRATPAELAAIEQACARGRAVIGLIEGRAGAAFEPADLDEWLEAEESFHVALMRAAHNRWSTKIMDELLVIARVFHAHRGRTGLLTPDSARQTVDEHAQLLELCRKKDAASARDCMARHVRRGRENVIGTEPGFSTNEE